MERCELSDLPEDQCACRVHGPGPDPEPRKGSFRAAFDSGECPACEEKVLVGQYIIRYAGTYMHEECLRDG